MRSIREKETGMRGKDILLTTKKNLPFANNEYYLSLICSLICAGSFELEQSSSFATIVIPWPSDWGNWS